MGGSAFSTHIPPLPTPRMPPYIYYQVLDSAVATLKNHYTQASSPIPAPSKTSHGDVDLLVFNPTNPSLTQPTTTTQVLTNREIASHLSPILNARAFIVEKGSATLNFAIPWPESTAKVSNEEDKFIQLDVHVCPNVQDYNWRLFQAAHGDLWNILGTTIRPYGLTVNDRGLFLRIQEIELFDRKKSMIFLTSSPPEILKFLGLDEGKWWEEFESMDEMFHYAASCRLFSVRDKSGDVIASGEGELIGHVKDVGEGQEGGESEKKKLKHNDRQRMAKRPIFAKWIEEFVPACREKGLYPAANDTATREQVCEEAWETFGVKKEHESRLNDWKLVRHQEEVWRACVKDMVPIEGVDPALRAAAIRELKSIVVEGENFEGRKVKVAETKDGYYDMDAVKHWVEENWRKAGVVRQAKQNVRSAKAMEEKAAKKAKTEIRVGEE